jgi:hypothetical protein
MKKSLLLAPYSGRSPASEHAVLTLSRISDSQHRSYMPCRSYWWTSAYAMEVTRMALRNRELVMTIRGIHGGIIRSYNGNLLGGRISE